MEITEKTQFKIDLYLAIFLVERSSLKWNLTKKLV